MTGMTAIVAARSPTPLTGPMETLADPELQRVMLQLRTRPGSTIVGLAGARRPLRAALARGEAVGVVGDRPISGGGVPIPLFDLPATLPDRARVLRARCPRPAARRRDPSRGSGLPRPHGDAGARGPELPLRSRIEALLAAEAEVFEEFVAAAPEQWWAVFHPIWEAVGPLPRAAARERLRAGAAA